MTSPRAVPIRSSLTLPCVLREAARLDELGLDGLDLLVGVAREAIDEQSDQTLRELRIRFPLEVDQVVFPPGVNVDDRQAPRHLVVVDAELCVHRPELGREEKQLLVPQLLVWHHLEPTNRLLQLRSELQLTHVGRGSN